MNDKFDFEKVRKEQGLKEALRQEGYWEGYWEGYRDLGQIVTRKVLWLIMEKSGKTLDEALDELEVPEDERDRYKDLAQ